jgi:hypothetical protein
MQPNSKHLVFPLGGTRARISPDSIRERLASQHLMEERIFHDRFNERYVDRSVLVGVNEAGATDHGSRFHCIGTTSLSSCVGLLAYDPENHVAAAAHAFIPAKAEGIGRHLYSLVELASEMISGADGLGGKSYQLRFFNVLLGAREPAATSQVAWALEGFARLLIAEERIIDIKYRGEYNFVVDSKTGGIFTGAEI